MKSFIKVLLLAIPIAITSCNEAKKPLEHEFTMKVWEKGAPESNNLKGPEYFNKDSTDVFNISVPEINIFLTQEANSGKMVLICPGGGYGMQAINKEGWEMARWLNKKGVNAAVLKYRLPNGNKDIPLKDALKAMKILKENSKDWGIEKVGVCGYSAGGHLASMVATKFDSESRPDFQILFYPVISLEEPITHWGSRINLLGEDSADDSMVKKYSSENNVTKDSPKAILFLSADDAAVSPDNSKIYKQKLEECGVECDMYIYPTGNHGWGTLRGFTYYNDWTRTLNNWLKEL